VVDEAIASLRRLASWLNDPPPEATPGPTPVGAAPRGSGASPTGFCGDLPAELAALLGEPPPPPVICTDCDGTGGWQADDGPCTACDGWGGFCPRPRPHLHVVAER
jgi:hypothetical protein